MSEPIRRIIEIVERERAMEASDSDDAAEKDLTAYDEIIDVLQEEGLIDPRRTYKYYNLTITRETVYRVRVEDNDTAVDIYMDIHPEDAESDDPIVREVHQETTKIEAELDEDQTDWKDKAHGL